MNYTWFSQHFNESTITEILDREKTFEQIFLKIDPPPEKRKQQAKEVNWIAKMMSMKRADRIKWPSKLYYFERKFSQKTLYDQAEDLMDMVTYMRVMCSLSVVLMGLSLFPDGRGLCQLAGSVGQRKRAVPIEKHDQDAVLDWSRGRIVESALCGTAHSEFRPR